MLCLKHKILSNSVAQLWYTMTVLFYYIDDVKLRLQNQQIKTSVKYSLCRHFLALSFTCRLSESASAEEWLIVTSLLMLISSSCKLADKGPCRLLISNSTIRKNQMGFNLGSVPASLFPWLIACWWPCWQETKHILKVITFSR